MATQTYTPTSSTLAFTRHDDTKSNIRHKTRWSPSSCTTQPASWLSHHRRTTIQEQKKIIKLNAFSHIVGITFSSRRRLDRQHRQVLARACRSRQDDCQRDWSKQPVQFKRVEGQMRCWEIRLRNNCRGTVCVRFILTIRFACLYPPFALISYRMSPSPMTAPLFSTCWRSSTLQEES